MKNLSLEAAAGVYSGTAHDAKPHPIHIERNKAFKAGAAWQRNHVWHRNTEMPSAGINENGIGKQCLVKAVDGIYKRPIIADVRCSDGCYYFVHFTGLWISLKNVITWAYLSDLMPAPFDEILDENKDVLQRLKKGETKP